MNKFSKIFRTIKWFNQFVIKGENSRIKNKFALRLCVSLQRVNHFKDFHKTGHQYYAIFVHPIAEVLVSFSNNNMASARNYEVKTTLNLGY